MLNLLKVNSFLATLSRILDVISSGKAKGVKMNHFEPNKLCLFVSKHHFSQTTDTISYKWIQLDVQQKNFYFIFFI